MIGEVTASSVVTLIRNRWPSGATAYWCLRGPSAGTAPPAILVSNSARLDLSRAEASSGNVPELSSRLQDIRHEVDAAEKVDEALA